jgi:hypothetical protein
MVVSYVIGVLVGGVITIIYEQVCLPSSSFPDGHIGLQNTVAGHKKKDFINNISY